MNKIINIPCFSSEESLNISFYLYLNDRFSISLKTLSFRQWPFKEKIKNKTINLSSKRFRPTIKIIFMAILLFSKCSMFNYDPYHDKKALLAEISIFIKQSITYI